MFSSSPSLSTLSLPHSVTLSSDKPQSHPFLPSAVRFCPPRATNTADRCSSEEKTAPNLASPSSFYEVLGLPMGATSQEIKAAYRSLARVYHPDVVSFDRKGSSADEFMKIHAAYSTLSDPKKRADYDLRISRRQMSFYSYSGASSTPVMSRFSGYTSRNWETDQCW